MKRRCASLFGRSVWNDTPRTANVRRKRRVCLLCLCVGDRKQEQEAISPKRGQYDGLFPDAGGANGQPTH